MRFYTQKNQYVLSNMDLSVDSFSLNNSGFIDLEASDNKSSLSKRAISIRSIGDTQNLTGNLVENSQSVPKMGSQFVYNNSFFGTMPFSMGLNPSLSQSQSLGIGTPSSIFFPPKRKLTLNITQPASDNNEKEEKLPRNRRMNIPQTTIINSKTREVI